MVRQTTGFSPDPPMTVDIEDSIVVSGTSGVIFDNDGGQLIVERVQVSSVSSAAVVATANTGTSFLQESTISASDIDSVTFTTAMGTQTVIDVEVSGMNSLGDVFYAEGSGSMLLITGSTLSQNNIVPPPTWNGVAAQSGASAMVMDTTIRDNSGIEFGVSATLGSTVSIKDSMITGNTGVVRFNLVRSDNVTKDPIVPNVFFGTGFVEHYNYTCICNFRFADNSGNDTDQQ